MYFFSAHRFSFAPLLAWFHGILTNKEFKYLLDGHFVISDQSNCFDGFSKYIGRKNAAIIFKILGKGQNETEENSEGGEEDDNDEENGVAPRNTLKRKENPIMDQPKTKVAKTISGKSPRTFSSNLTSPPAESPSSFPAFPSSAKSPRPTIPQGKSPSFILHQTTSSSDSDSGSSYDDSQ